MIQIQKTDREKLEAVSSLFKGWDDTMIWSCLEGEMGAVYVSDEMLSAKLEIGDFCFFGGKADENLVYHKKRDYELKLKILVPQNRGWGCLIEKVYGESVTIQKRYSFEKSAAGFSRKKLCKIMNELNEGEKKKFILTDIDSCPDLFNEVSRCSWASDWICQFRGYEDYRKRGMGVALTYNGELIAGASSYTVYSKGIEIQIDTREDFRNQGLGKICGAALILRCLNRGLYPSWDADNEISARLASSLGYNLDGEYLVYKTQQNEREYCRKERDTAKFIRQEKYE